MRFFMTTEADHTVSDAVSDIAFKEIEPKLTNYLTDSYGDALASMSIIPIIVNNSPELEAAGFFKERVLFKRKDKDCDVRLRIPYQKFLQADTETKRLLLIKNVIDSVRAIGLKAKKGLDSERLENDILKLFDVERSVIDGL